MSTAKLQVFDPPMCCSSGACGPTVDPQLVRFTSDLDWLQKQGVVVERFSLSLTPAAFAQTAVVSNALQSEGPDCLPLLVVDAAIVHRGGYPERKALARLCGIDADVALKPAGAAVRPGEADTIVYGPECNCTSTSGSRRAKVAIGIIALLAVAGILIYKASVGGSADAASHSAIPQESGFAVTSEAETSKSSSSADSLENGNSSAGAASDDVMAPSGAEAVQTAVADASIGEYLDSLNELNTVAVDTDAVFIFVPGSSAEAASDSTRTAVLAAQKKLASSGVKLGLFTLNTAANDFARVASQVQIPAILVLCKGRSMASVTGEVTETKLIQAYMTSASTGGCGPSGCGPSGGC